MIKQRHRVLIKFSEIYMDEAVFLSLVRSSALLSTNYLLGEIAELEERLDANLDGLRVFGDEGWKCCENNLDIKEAGEILTASLVALNPLNKRKLEKVFSIAGDDQILLNAIVSAFVWYSFEDVNNLLVELFASKEISKQYVGLCAFAEHRQPPEILFSQALKTKDERLISRAIQAVAETGMRKLYPAIVPFIESDNESIAFQACWAATRFGHKEGMEKLKSFVASPLYYEKALQYVVMQKDINNTVDIIKKLLSDENTARFGVIGLGYLGNPKTIPKIIECMKTPELARISGNAFSDITGIDLVESKMDAESPVDFDAGPTDDPEDENVDMDPDEDLPWPNVELISAWWANPQNQANFSNADRFLLGQPVSKNQYNVVLKTGNQKQRALAANCLGAYEQDKPVFNVFAPAKRQMKLLGMAI